MHDNHPTQDWAVLVSIDDPVSQSFAVDFPAAPVPLRIAARLPFPASCFLINCGVLDHHFTDGQPALSGTVGARQIAAFPSGEMRFAFPKFAKKQLVARDTALFGLVRFTRESSGQHHASTRLSLTASSDSTGGNPARWRVRLIRSSLKAGSVA